MKFRMLASLAVLVSAGIHLRLWFTVFRHAHVVGPAFMLNAVGGLVIAILLLSWRHWLPLLLAVGFGVSTMGAFLIAVTHGLYGVHEHWTSWEVFVAFVAEAVAILAGLAAYADEHGDQLSDGGAKPFAVHRRHAS